MKEEKNKEVKEKVEELKNNPDNVETNNEDEETKKVDEIIKKVKEKGNITYGELATELGEINPEQIDKVFDVMEEMGVEAISDDIEEPDIEDLEEVENLKLWPWIVFK